MRQTAHDADLPRGAGDDAKDAATPRAVRFGEYGGIDVLKVAEVEAPVPGPGHRPGDLRRGRRRSDPVRRINTIIDFAAAEKYGVHADGDAAADTPDVLAELARLVAEGRLEVPIARTYPLDEVRGAFEELEQRHTQGKVVLRP